MEKTLEIHLNEQREELAAQIRAFFSEPPMSDFEEGFHRGLELAAAVVDGTYEEKR